MVRAGDMRHEVTIQVRSTSQDSTGEPLNTWSTFATRRAALVRTPGSEVFASAQRGGRVPTVFELRHLAGVLPEMRVLFNGRIHNILSAIDPDNGRGERMHITAEELVEASP